MATDSPFLPVSFFFFLKIKVEGEGGALCVVPSACTTVGHVSLSPVWRKKTILSFVALDEPNNYMQNNFSQENGTSKVNSKAGEGCYGSQSKIYPVIFYLLLSDGAQNALRETEWKRKRAGSETYCTSEENPAKKNLISFSKKEKPA